VTLTGKQKAALLLTSLDATTAAELLKGVDPRIVRELAVELSYLNASGYRNTTQIADVTQQFCRSLQKKPDFQFKNFLTEMLRSAVGEEPAKRIQHEIQDLLQKRDPFLAIRAADSQILATILQAEHPQAVAVVLSELPARKGSEVLGLLGEATRVAAIGRMTSIGSVTPEAKARIAQMACERLKSASKPEQAATTPQVRPEDALRKIAVIVRNLEKEIREGVLEAIQHKDKEAGAKISNLMVIWEDIPSIGDRSLQEALRGIDVQQLALALYEAPEEVARRMKACISERAAAMVDEEISLMSAPKKEDILQAREKIVATLREWNDKGELTFREE